VEIIPAEVKKRRITFIKFLLAILLFVEKWSVIINITMSNWYSMNLYKPFNNIETFEKTRNCFSDNFVWRFLNINFKYLSTHVQISCQYSSLHVCQKYIFHDFSLSMYKVEKKNEEHQMGRQTEEVRNYLYFESLIIFLQKYIIFIYNIIPHFHTPFFIMISSSPLTTKC